MSDTATTDAKPRMLQWWMTANFAVGAGFSAFMAVVTWFAAKEPERTLHEAMYASSADGDSDEIVEGPEVDAKAKVPLKAVLGSSFGLFLLVGTLSSMANNGINSQISNKCPTSTA